MLQTAMSRYLTLFLTYLIAASSHAGGWEYIIVDQGEVTIDQLVKRNNWVVQESPVLNLGFTNKEVWLRHANVTEGEKDYLMVDNPTLAEIDFYVLKGDQVIKSVFTGFTRNVSKQDLTNPAFIFEIPKSQQDITLYIRIKTYESMVIPLKFYSDSILKNEILPNKHTTSYLVLGVLLSLSILYLIIFLSLRESGYLYYSLYAFFVQLTVLKSSGLLTFWLWPQQAFISCYSGVIEGVVSVTAGLFAIHFLQLKKYSPIIYKVIIGLVILAVIAVFVSLSGYNQVAVIIIESGASVFILIMTVATSFIFLKYRTKSAKYYLISSVFLFTGSLIYIAKNYGLISPDSFVLSNSLELGIASEMIFLAIGVSKRIDQLRLDLLKAQQQNVKILTAQNKTLETVIDDKTKKLSAQNATLQRTIENLKQTQAKLIVSEKLASVGQLTSGLAHEMNNPINYIKGGAESILQNLNDLSSIEKTADRLIQALNEAIENGSQADGSTLEKIQTDWEHSKHDLNYTLILNETVELAKGIEQGASKTVTILNNLSYLSSDNHQSFGSIDIEDQVKSIMQLIQPSIGPGNKLITNFGNVGRVDFIPGQFNQLMMNLLLNAVQAIDENGQIEIMTRMVNDHVEISIKDNGPGVSDSIGNKIFEPFFSTREHHVGLGLTIAQSIVSEHNGEITFRNHDSGIEFLINIPVSQGIS
jgi:hypothetical protein